MWRKPPSAGSTEVSKTQIGEEDFFARIPQSKRERKAREHVEPTSGAGNEHAGGVLEARK
jgi:hypothetical protein